MAKHAVVIIGDKDYLLPSAAVAITAKQNLSRPDVDVLLFVVVNGDDPTVSAAAERLLQQGIQVQAIQLDELLGYSKYHTDKAVPVSALSRLWLHRYLDNSIKTFLYLDGDTLVTSSLDPLFDLPVPEGGLLAADDCLCLFEHELRFPRRYWQPYLQSIGVAWRDYFNSGVLLIDRAGWEKLAGEALDYLTTHAELCRSSDQTALNVVAGKRRGTLPLRWNYQTEHMMVLDPRKSAVKPAIWHFAGGPKPWDRPDWPWDDSFNSGLRQAERALAGLDIPRPPVNKTMLEEGVKHRRRQRNLQRWRFLHRKFLRAWRVKQRL